ncbi:hypothetical protein [Aurantimonas sp. VKM B-3413]|uniref:hypothetical protein n=1 Tax=Aurantimonas sp. VKM B-3413 TaxID=2779401 RepID=UPI001E37FDF4|nr:hypothetical protein [Aurantimonas sp. VKM B-3413]MCB8836700.1 hypothetical protein [Aurantimonas sp. VKM B-3413]
MTKLHVFASALTISAAALASGSALADCSQDLAAFKGSMTTQSSASTDTSGQAVSTDAGQSGKVAADKTPGDKDQAAVNSPGTETYTEMNADNTMDEGKQSTGAMSGVAPTAALGKVASSSQEEDSNASSSGHTTGGAAAANATGEASSQQASSANGQSGDDAMTTSSTNSGALGGMDQSGSGDMVQTHLAAAQKAADAGNEEACMTALDAAKAAANQ